MSSATKAGWEVRYIDLKTWLAEIGRAQAGPAIIHSSLYMSHSRVVIYADTVAQHTVYRLLITNIEDAAVAMHSQYYPNVDTTAAG